MENTKNSRSILKLEKFPRGLHIVPGKNVFFLIVEKEMGGYPEKLTAGFFLRLVSGKKIKTGYKFP